MMRGAYGVTQRAATRRTPLSAPASGITRGTVIDMADTTAEDSYSLDPPRSHAKLDARTLRVPTAVWDWYERVARANGTSRNKLMWAMLVRGMAQEEIMAVLKFTLGVKLAQPTTGEEG